MERILKIGRIRIKYPVLMSPMASITDIAFRKLLDELGGVGLMVTELLSAEAIRRKSKRTLEMLKTFDSLTPQFVQLFGSREDSFIEAGKYIENETNYQGIDINLGCPAKKVIKKGGGSALLNDLEKMKKILKALKKAVSFPVTAKIRLGYAKTNVQAVIDLLNEVNIDAVTVHFRLKIDNYSVPARWEYAEGLRERINSVFIGNGDIKNVFDIGEKLKVCDAVMIGRGAVCNPLIFARYSCNFREGGKLNTTWVIKRLTELIEEHYEEKFFLNKLKAYIKYFYSSRRHAKSIRQKLYQCKTYEEAKAYLRSIESQYIRV